VVLFGTVTVWRLLFRPKMWLLLIAMCVFKFPVATEHPPKSDRLEGMLRKYTFFSLSSLGLSSVRYMRTMQYLITSCLDNFSGIKIIWIFLGEFGAEFYKPYTSRMFSQHQQQNVSSLFPVVYRMSNGSGLHYVHSFIHSFTHSLTALFKLGWR